MGLKMKKANIFTPNQEKKYSDKHYLSKLRNEIQQKINKPEYLNELNEIYKAIRYRIQKTKVINEDYINREIMLTLAYYEEKNETPSKQLNYVWSIIEDTCRKKFYEESKPIEKKEIQNNWDFWSELYFCCRVLDLNQRFFSHMRYEGFSPDGTCNPGLKKLLKHFVKYFSDKEIRNNDDYCSRIKNLKYFLCSFNFWALRTEAIKFQIIKYKKDIEFSFAKTTGASGKPLERMVSDFIQCADSGYFIDTILRQIDTLVKDHQSFNKNQFYIFLKNVGEFQYEEQLSELELNLIKSLKETIDFEILSSLFLSFENTTKQIKEELNTVSSIDIINNEQQIVQLLLNNKTIINEGFNLINKEVNKSNSIKFDLFEYFILFFRYLIQSTYKSLFNRHTSEKTYSDSIIAVIFSYALFVALYGNARCDIFDKGDTWNREAVPENRGYKQRNFINLLKDLKKKSHYETDFVRMYNMIILIMRIILNPNNSDYTYIENFYARLKRIRAGIKKLCLFPTYKLPFTLNNTVIDIYEMFYPRQINLLLLPYFNKKQKQYKNECTLEIKSLEETVAYTRSSTYAEDIKQQNYALNHTAKLSNADIKHTTDCAVSLGWDLKFDDRDKS